MSKKQKLNVDDAYALETPADSVRLYGDWAETYDTNFVETSGYVVYMKVAAQLLQRKSAINGPVLDVGCGTGVVGVCLKEGGIEEIDGIDISEPMLVEAGKKKTKDGESIYRNLIAADLTKTIDVSDNLYAGIISAGTFTHGHLGPEALNELFRVAAPGAQCAIGVRTTHYEAANFGGKLAVDVANGTITQPELIDVKMYSDEADNPEHADDKAFIVVCRVI